MNLNIQNCKQFSQNIVSNTFIGGIAKQGGTGVNNPIDTAWKLSQKLGVNVNRISGFKITGDNVECRIKGSYNLPDFGADTVASANQNITSFIDEDSLVTSQVSLGGFQNCKNIQAIKLNGLVTAYQVFRNCNHISLGVEMLNLKTTISAFFSQLNDNFNQIKLYAGFPSLENLGTLAFHNVNGFTELNLPTVKVISTQSFYSVRNCVNYYLNNVTQAGSEPWRHGNSACKLIEMKKCKVVGSIFFDTGTGTSVPHSTDFTMRLNIAIKFSNAVTHTKTNYPWTVIELYDDNGVYIETI